MGATKGFFICRARLKTDLFPTHRRNMLIWFIFVFLIIRRGPLRRVNSSRGGLITRAGTRHYFSSMPRTKPIFSSQIFRIQFSKFREHGSFFFSGAAIPEMYTLSLHDALPCQCPLWEA